MNNLSYTSHINFFSLSLIGMSMATALLIFYVLMANSTNNLLSYQLRDYLTTNRTAQHLIGIITMLLIITQFSGIKEPKKIITYTSLCYLWFILTTKLDLTWNLAIIGLLVVGYLYDNKLIKKELIMKKDDALTKLEKDKIKWDHKKIRLIAIVVILIITLIGTSMYFNKKRIKFGDDFNIGKFIYTAPVRYQLVK